MGSGRRLFEEGRERHFDLGSVPVVFFRSEWFANSRRRVGWSKLLVWPCFRWLFFPFPIGKARLRGASFPMVSTLSDKLLMSFPCLILIFTANYARQSTEISRGGSLLDLHFRQSFLQQKGKHIWTK